MAKKKKPKFSFITFLINMTLVFSLLLLGVSSYTLYTNKSNLEDAYLFGYKLIYMSTPSMEPAISEHSIFVVKQAEINEIQKDDIILYKMDSRLVTHRVVSKDGIEIKTKGDANEIEDSYIVTDQNLKAKVVMPLNFTAVILKNSSSPQFLLYYVALPFIGIMGTLTIISILLKSKKEPPDEEEDADKEDDNNIPQEISATENDPEDELNEFHFEDEKNFFAPFLKEEDGSESDDVEESFDEEESRDIDLLSSPSGAEWIEDGFLKDVYDEQESSVESNDIDEFDDLSLAFGLGLLDSDNQ